MITVLMLLNIFMVDSSVARPWAVLIIVVTGISVVVPVAVLVKSQNQAD
jgi:hypothetical protein